MKKNRREPVYDITDLPKPERPNYTLRRLGVGLAAVGLTAIGVEAPVITHAITHIGENAYDQHDCQPGGGSVTVLPGETVWEEAGAPLAKKIGVPVDEAMSILDAANPNIPSLGDVQAGTTIVIPICK